MELSRAVQEFLADCRMRLTPASMAAYESGLTRLVALASPGSVLGFTPDLIRAYFLGLSHSAVRAPATPNVGIAARMGPRSTRPGGIVSPRIKARSSERLPVTAGHSSGA
jgi:hypothetical protein